jgi:hypothetical protein
MKDINRKELQIGDWVLSYFFGNTMRVDRIVSLLYDDHGYEPCNYVVLSRYPYRSTYASNIEKLPDDEAEREQILLLRKFEQ